MTDLWNSKDTLTLIIEIITGIGISFLTAYIYEKKTNLRRQNNLLKKYSFLQSNQDDFDWRHWNINNGEIEKNPIDGYMTLKYYGEKRFSFKWKEPGSGEIQGDGFIFWEDLIHGKMSFYKPKNHWFDYRNVYHKKIEHQGIGYDAIFVNADDQGTRYVMLRPLMS